ncbi:glycosyltransferase family 4 protein [Blastopirellula marina]|nr:glycosyltransferase family 4 protein [Blastopirellula marina]
MPLTPMREVANQNADEDYPLLADGEMPIRLRIPSNENPMRIAIAIPRIAPERGGAESWSLQFCQWLLAMGHDVRIIGLQAADKLPLPAECVQVINTRCRTSAIRELDAIYDAEQFDIIHDMGLGVRFDIFQSHVGSRHALQAGSLNSRPPLLRFITGLAQKVSQRKRILNRISDTQFANPSAWYVAVSRMVAQGLHALEHIPQERIHCVPNGINTDLYRPAATEADREQARRRFAIAPDELCLLTIAHNHRLKGVPLLVSAIRRSQAFQQNLHLLVVGGRHENGKRVQLGKHRVTFTGPLSDPTPTYIAADVCVHPTFYDACSLTVLEALSCGLPTITTLCNGAADRIVHGVNGYLLPSPHEMRQLLMHLNTLASPEVRRRMGVAAREAALSWTIEDNFRAMESLHRACLAAKTQTDAFAPTESTAGLRLRAA